MTLLRTGSAGLLVMAGAPYLAWLSLNFLDRLPGGLLRLVPVEFGRYTHCSEFLVPTPIRSTTLMLTPFASDTSRREFLRFVSNAHTCTVMRGCCRPPAW